MVFRILTFELVSDFVLRDSSFPAPEAGPAVGDGTGMTTSRRIRGPPQSSRGGIPLC
jgi:hypothetical protein